MRSALEIAHWEEKLGHEVVVQEPSGDEAIYGQLGGVDLHCVHSQFPPKFWHDDKPKIMWLHGEPLSSVANGISMKAICELAGLCDAFICMRQEEHAVWNMIRRCYVVQKGVDLERYKPMDVKEKLSGAPCVLYCENWRGQRNPLYLIAAMKIVFQKYPDARLHLYNCQDPKVHSQIKAFCDTSKAYPFVRSLTGPAEDVVELYNRADIIVSCLHPLYARTAVESLACGKIHVSPGYSVPGYPFACDYTAESMAAAIIKAWEDKEFSGRKWAEENHSAEEMVRQAIKVYERYV